MKTRYYVLLGIIGLCLSLYLIDRHCWVRKRVLRHGMWENKGGVRLRGDLILMRNLIYFENGIMVFDEPEGLDTLIFLSQYFSTLRLKDPKTNEIGIYSMKGASFVDFLPGQVSYRNHRNYDPRLKENN